MPLFKQERTVTIYVDADSPWDIMFGTTVDPLTEPEPKFQIRHWNETVQVAKEVSEKEYQKVREEFEKNMKCPDVK